MKRVTSALLEQIQRQLKLHGRINLLDQRYAQLISAASRWQDNRDNPERLSRQGLLHDKQVIPYQGLPYLMTQQYFESLARKFAQLAQLIERLIELYLRLPAIRNFLQLPCRDEQLIRLPVNSRPMVQYCRFDFTIDDLGRPRIFEFNTRAPTGATCYRRIAEVFNQSQIYTELQQAGLGFSSASLESRGLFALATLQAAQQAGALKADHSAAILGSRRQPPHREQAMIAAQFIAAGKPAMCCHVEDLHYQDGCLRYHDTPIDICLNLFDLDVAGLAATPEYQLDQNEISAYLCALAGQAVFATNSLASMYLPEHKSCLALLWSPLLQPYLSTQEIALIQELIPYTRILRDLTENEFKHLQSNKSEMVLKRSLDKQGRSVVIGRDVTQQDWQAALQYARATQAQGDYVIQELSPVETLSAQLSASETPSHYFTSLGCFMIQGKAQGMMVCSSPQATTNLARSGFVQPFVLVE